MSTNPFAVSRVGLTQLQFLEAKSGMVDLVAAKLRKSAGRGQIIGPHGSGKTTLTVALANVLAGQFQRFTWLVLQPGSWWFSGPQCRVQLAARAYSQGRGLEVIEFNAGEISGRVGRRLQQLRENELCFIDGVDQLSVGWRRRLIQAAGKNAVVWTAHRQLPDRLPVLAELRPDLRVFRKLVEQLLANAGTSLDSEVVDRAFELSDGDIRRAFGRLYDSWEQAKFGA